MLRDFLAWWCAQLADLLPQELRRSALSTGDALIVAPIGPLGRGVEAVDVGLRRNGKGNSLGRFALGAIGMADLPRVAGRTTLLLLGEADVLGKTVTLPLAAERELDQALAFEMDRETPFAPEELYWDYRVTEADRQNGRLQVRLSLVPKNVLDPLLADLAAVGLRPSAVEIADGPDRGARWRCAQVRIERGMPRTVCCCRLRPLARRWLWPPLSRLLYSKSSIWPRSTERSRPPSRRSRGRQPAPGNRSPVGQRRLYRKRARQDRTAARCVGGGDPHIAGRYF